MLSAKTPSPPVSAGSKGNCRDQASWDCADAYAQVLGWKGPVTCKYFASSRGGGMVTGLCIMLHAHVSGPI
jgi:hypothetical protein